MTPEWKQRGQQLLQKYLPKKSVRLLLCFLGILLILLLLFTRQSGESSSNDEVTLEETTDLKDYQSQLESQLEEILSHIQNAGSVQVLVTLEKGVETIYATEDKTSHQITNRNSMEEKTEKETTYIFQKNADGGQEAVAVTQLQPVVKGVVVACSGAGNPVVVRQISEAVMTALHIPSTQVCVVQAATKEKGVY